MPSQELSITKSQRGWSVKSTVRYPGWPNPAVTHSGHRTLATALWQAISLDMAVVGVTVKGNPISNQRAFEIISKALSGGTLAHQLPRYYRTLMSRDSTLCAPSVAS